MLSLFYFKTKNVNLGLEPKRKQMKKLSIIAFISLFAIAASAQTPKTSDTIKVFRTNNTDIKNGPVAYFINGTFMRTFPLINPEIISNVNIVKEDFVDNGKTYHGKVLITTKPDVKFNFISLDALKEKYTNLSNTSAVFMVDGKIIKSGAQYVLNEFDVLSIEIDDIDYQDKNIPLLKILSKTEENIRKSKEIRIRGRS